MESQESDSSSNRGRLCVAATADSTPATKPKRACDTCHKRKVKCDRNHPSCSECVKFGVDCTYIVAATPKKITRNRPKRREALEKKVTELESILQQALKNHESTTSSQPNQGRVIPKPTFPSFPTTASSSVHGPPFNFSFGSSAGYVRASLLQELVDWVPRPFRSFVKTCSSNNIKDKTLKERQEYVTLIRIYFSTLNQTITLFDQEDFFARFSELEMDQIRADAALWTATNVMCALALRQDAAVPLIGCPRSRAQEAWQYLHAALEKAVEITIRGSEDLLAIQALLGMTIFLQSSPDAHPASTILAAAIRLVLQHGLHVQKQGQPLDQLDFEAARRAIQRNRVFWIAYYLDHDLASRLERPPLIHEDDIGIDLPPLYPEDGLGYILSINGSITINYMRVRAHLALIEGHIHQRLISARARRQTSIERQTAIQELEVELSSWKASSPDLSSTLDNLDSTSTDGLPRSIFGSGGIFLLRVLYLTYLNCHTNLHGFSYRTLRVHTWDHPRYQIRAPESSPLQLLPLVLAIGGDLGPPGCCVSSARASLNLFRITDYDHACSLAALHHHVTALIVLVAHAAKDPLADESMADLQLVLPVVEMLHNFEEVPQDSSVAYAKRIATQLVHEYARRALFE
ncbi:fungal-specific transcription factor domain-containing protein [Trichoderma austrokoningii]